MSLYDKINELAREQADKTFRVLSANLASQTSTPPLFAMVDAANGDGTYQVILPSGQVLTVTAAGSNLIAVGQTYHITGTVIF